MKTLNISKLQTVVLVGMLFTAALIFAFWAVDTAYAMQNGDTGCTSCNGGNESGGGGGGGAQSECDGGGQGGGCGGGGGGGGTGGTSSSCSGGTRVVVTTSPDNRATSTISFACSAVGTAPSVIIDWQSSYTSCTNMRLQVKLASASTWTNLATGLPCNGSVTWSAAAANSSYDYRLRADALSGDTGQRFTLIDYIYGKFKLALMSVKNATQHLFAFLYPQKVSAMGGGDGGGGPCPCAGGGQSRSCCGNPCSGSTTNVYDMEVGTFSTGICALPLKQCQNSPIDDDGDGLVDAADPGCHGDGDATNPASYLPLDDTEDDVWISECANTIDDADPEDALVDAADPGCHDDGDPTNPASYDPAGNNESDNPRCSDLRDNDVDGVTDAADPGCHTDADPTNPVSYDPNDNDETNATQCSDGVDNDGDGKNNYPADLGCTNAGDDDEFDTCVANAGQPCAGPYNNTCVPPIFYSGIYQCNGVCSAGMPPNSECGLPDIDCGSGPGSAGCIEIFNKGDTCTITFSVNNANRCVIAPVGSGPGGATFNNITTPPPETHTWTTPPLDVSTLYTITCYNGPAVLVSKTFSCKLNPKFEPF